VDIDIAVVGSLNHDLTIVAARLPVPGETVLGSHHYSGNGGKGANQAVAAARLGAGVAMFGLVGNDEHGQALVDGLTSEGIDVAGVGVDNNSQTGLAVITVDKEAENTIVVSPGTNSRFTARHLEDHPTSIAQAKVLLTQLEVPPATVLRAAEVCKGIVCLNPAPAQTIAVDLFDQVDVLVPNRSELGLLAGVSEPTNLDQTVEAVSLLPFAGAVVVTLGSEGALSIENGTPTFVAAHDVEALDPTGAGDAFCGALAHALSLGNDLTESTRWANAAGAIATTRPGAQSSMPTATEVEALLGA